MKRQHPYDEKCRCRRCRAVKQFVAMAAQRGRKAIVRNGKDVIYDGTNAAPR